MLEQFFESNVGNIRLNKVSLDSLYLICNVYSVHKMAKRTSKTLPQILQDFRCVFGYFINTKYCKVNRGFFKFYKPILDFLIIIFRENQ